MDRFINPFTDFGFKRLFGTEKNKNILLDFLNELLSSRTGEIKTVTFKKNEHLGSLDVDRRAIFDIYCENEDGEKFIVEMQKAKQAFFKDRALYYSTFPIQEQARKGTWDYKLKAIYTIAVLDFEFEVVRHSKSEVIENVEDYIHYVKLMEINRKEVFYDKLTFIYLEMPKFKKSLKECKNHFEKWFFILKHLSELNEIPPELREGVFSELFEEAKQANLSPEELHDYEEDLKNYRDLHNVLETARKEGREEGREEGEYKKAVETAKKMLEENLSVEMIVRVSGLSVEEINKLN